MTTTLTISDALAVALEARRRADGFASLNEAAEALLQQALAPEPPGFLDGYPIEELRTLIQEAEDSGPAERFDMQELRDFARGYAAGGQAR